METNVKFEVVLAIGLYGMAALAIHEQPTLAYQCPEGEEPDCIADDICNYGPEDWFDGLPLDRPEQPGVYRISGEASFTEDDSEYPTASISPSVVTIG